MKPTPDAMELVEKRCRVMFREEKLRVEQDPDGCGNVRICPKNEGGVKEHILIGEDPDSKMLGLVRGNPEIPPGR